MADKPTLFPTVPKLTTEESAKRKARGEGVVMLDMLRRRSLGHAALMSMLQRPCPQEIMGDASATADWILECLWLDGCKVVPVVPLPVMDDE